MNYQEKEMSTTYILDAYCGTHKDASLIFTFAEGDSYLCSFDTAYDSGNFYEVDEFGEEEEEFNELLYKIEKVIVPGPNGEPFRGIKGGMVKRVYIAINYRHFPVLITTEDGEQIYPVQK